MTASPSPAPARRRWIIRAAGSAFLLGLLFWLLPVDEVIAALKAIPLSVFLLVLLLFLTAHAGAALKWWLLLDRGLPPMLAVRAHYAGLAANLCLPGAVGGDAVRAGLAQVAMKDGARVVAGAATDRLIDMIALLTVSCLGLALSWNAGAEGGMILRAALILAGALAGMVALPRLLPLPWRIVPKLPGRGLRRTAGGGLYRAWPQARDPDHCIPVLNRNPAAAGRAGLVAGRRRWRRHCARPLDIRLAAGQDNCRSASVSERAWPA